MSMYKFSFSKVSNSELGKESFNLINWNDNRHESKIFLLT